MFCPDGDIASLHRLLAVALWIMAVPLMAFLYSLLVWATYAFYREIPWGHPQSLRALLLRWILVILTWIASAGAVSVCGTCGESPSTVGFGCLMGITSAVTIVVAVVCYKLILQTRRDGVVGIRDAAADLCFGPSHLAGKLVVVTGANNGIGFETTRQLAAQGATVLMLCRNRARAETASEDIRRLQADLHVKDPVSHPAPEIAPSQLVFVPVDLTDFGSIRRAVKDVGQHLEKHPSDFVDALVLNAGLMMGTQSTTKDGLETMMQANHLGHFLMMKLLLEKGMLKTTCGDNGDNAAKNASNNEPSRVCILTSSTYLFAASTTGFDFVDPYCSNGQREYTLFGQYSMTKLANLLTARELARRYNTGGAIDSRSDLAVFAIHPGIVRTNVTSNMTWFYRMGNRCFAWIVAALQKTPSEGAYSTVYTVAAPLRTIPYWRQGSYVVNCQRRKANDYVEGPTGGLDATRLWEWSEEQLRSAEERQRDAARTTAVNDEKKEQ